jgi:hypothetical protein
LVFPRPDVLGDSSFVAHDPKREFRRFQILGRARLFAVAKMGMPGFQTAKKPLELHIFHGTEIVARGFKYWAGKNPIRRTSSMANNQSGQGSNQSGQQGQSGQQQKRQDQPQSGQQSGQQQRQQGSQSGQQDKSSSQQNPGQQNLSGQQNKQQR